MGVYVFFSPHEEASGVAACNGNRARKIGDPCAENPHTPNPNATQRKTVSPLDRIHGLSGQ